MLIAWRKEKETVFGKKSHREGDADSAGCCGWAGVAKGHVKKGIQHGKWRRSPSTEQAEYQSLETVRSEHLYSGNKKVSVEF